VTAAFCHATGRRTVAPLEVVTHSSTGEISIIDPTAAIVLKYRF
jgi:hypothetical protein